VLSTRRKSWSIDGKNFGKFHSPCFNSNVLYGYLEKKYEEIILQDIELGGARVGGLAWVSFHHSAASVTAYQKTGEKRFIEQYIRFYDKLMERRDSEVGIEDDHHDRTMNSWGSAYFGEDEWVAIITHFAVIMKPATELALLIKTDPALAKYTTFSDEVLAYFKPAYLEYDVDLKLEDESGEKWYWRPKDEKFEATNHLHLLGQTLLNMYELTGEEFYEERIRMIIRVFEKGVLIDDIGFVTWNYHPYFQIEEAMSDYNARHYSEKVWKAGLTIPFLYEADAAGFAIDQKIVDATTKTIRDHVLANNNFSSNFHPNGSVAIENDSHGKKSKQQKAIVLFLPAAVKDSTISDLILSTVANRQDLYSEGWLTNRMVRGYAYFLNSPSKED